ncbi:hypothetical protein GCM10009118_14340 [Wandonia haliotis]|uniref:Uncharacterized protein n=1 Tax=Wandonia haliotis TaxID=574963 RepID=A0ABN1MP36_9FLAO
MDSLITKHNKKLLSILVFAIIHYSVIAQNKGYSIQGNIEKVYDNRDHLRINTDDVIIFDLPFFYLQSIKLDSSLIDTFDTGSQYIHDCFWSFHSEGKTQLFGQIETSGRYLYLSSLLKNSNSLNKLDSILANCPSTRGSYEGSNLEKLNYSLECGDNNQELKKHVISILKNIDLEVFLYQLSNKDYLPLDFWFETNLISQNRFFYLVGNDHIGKVPKIFDYTFILSDDKSTLKKQYKTIKKSFNISKRILQKNDEIKLKEGIVLRIVR